MDQNQTIKTENMLQVMVEEVGLSKPKAQTLLERFGHYFKLAAEWEKKTESLIVVNEDQVAEMKMAREGRLFLRQERIRIENTRKELKADILREGKALDGIANVLKHLIIPIEEYLDRQENFIVNKKAEEEAAHRAEVEKRMEEERIEREKKEVEDKRIADEKAKADQERIRAENVRVKAENDRVKAEAAEREKKLKEESEAKQRKTIEEAAERERKLKAESSAREKKAREEKEAVEKKLREHKEAEEKKIRDEEERQESLKNSSDRFKLMELRRQLKAITYNVMGSKSGKEKQRKVQALINESIEILK